tara:strand:+ start:321 stop:518 length:198 start_codon:yes stop_codon:yes gene_type:complete
MDYTYELEYRDHEGDNYTDTFKNDLQKARKRIAEIIEEGYEIIQTWRYLDGEYLGPIPPRNSYNY